MGFTGEELFEKYRKQNPEEYLHFIFWPEFCKNKECDIEQILMLDNVLWFILDIYNCADMTINLDEIRPLEESLMELLIDYLGLFIINWFYYIVCPHCFQYAIESEYGDYDEETITCRECGDDFHISEGTRVFVFNSEGNISKKLLEIAPEIKNLHSLYEKLRYYGDRYEYNKHVINLEGEAKEVILEKIPELIETSSKQIEKYHTLIQQIDEIENYGVLIENPDISTQEFLISYIHDLSHKHTSLKKEYNIQLDYLKELINSKSSPIETKSEKKKQNEKSNIKKIDQYIPEFDYLNDELKHDLQQAIELAHPNRIGKKKYQFIGILLLIRSFEKLLREKVFEPFLKELQETGSLVVLNLQEFEIQKFKKKKMDLGAFFTIMQKLTADKQKYKEIQRTFRLFCRHENPIWLLKQLINNFDILREFRNSFIHGRNLIPFPQRYSAYNDTIEKINLILEFF